MRKREGRDTGRETQRKEGRLQKRRGYPRGRGDGRRPEADIQSMFNDLVLLPLIMLHGHRLRLLTSEEVFKLHGSGTEGVPSGRVGGCQVSTGKEGGDSRATRTLMSRVFWDPEGGDEKIP